MGIEQLRQIRENRDKPKEVKIYRLNKVSPKTIAKRIGEKYNNLTILSFHSQTTFNDLAFNCLCECGKEKIVTLKAMRSGNTKSCGCLNSSNIIKRNTTHGLSHLKEYKHWSYMKSRCSATEGNNYNRYAKRGINVCDRWAASFEAFLEDMGPMPGTEYTVERRNNNLGYCPDNCIWATMQTQAKNRRTSIWIEYEGKNQLLSDWAKEMGLPIKTVSERYSKGLRGAELFYKGQYKNSGNAILGRWFNAKREQMSGICMHCGGETSKKHDRYFRFCIAHILPKRIFKSVATHPSNWIELCFWGKSCHTNLDNNMLDIMELNCFDTVIRRFVEMYPSIDPKERRYIPEVLLQYLEVEK